MREEEGNMLSHVPIESHADTTWRAYLCDFHSQNEVIILELQWHMKEEM